MGLKCLLSDFHFGYKKASELFLNNSIKCIRNEIIPYLLENDIKDIYILGDIFDNRNTINVKVKNVVYDLFDIDLKNFNIKILTGNHDIFHKNTISIHSLKMFKKFHNIQVIEDIILEEVDGKKFLFVPWQVDYQEFTNKIANKNIFCDAAFMHADINGSYMNRLSSVTKDGLDPNILFNNYQKVFSGHFHLHSVTNRGDREIIYVGTQYELNRNDKNVPKGFIILNTDDMSHEFIKTKDYLKYVDITYPIKPTRKLIEGNIVDCSITVDKDFSDVEYAAYMKLINSYNPVSVIPITTYNIFNNTYTDDKFNVKTTLESVKDYIYGVLELTDDDKQLIYEKIELLYSEATIN
jgi:DNA repair exonuclease SbcCD nuclease subunit